MSKTQSRRGLKSRIILLLLPSIIPLVAIVAASAYEARRQALFNGEEFTSQVVSSATEGLESYIKEEHARFRSWTEEEVYGIAIEYKTLKEVDVRFAELIKDSTNLSLLLLCDTSGRILSAGGPLADKARGLTAPELVRFAETDQAFSGVANSELLAKLGSANPYTFIFSKPSRGSNGKINGSVVAFLNWSQLITRTETDIATIRHHGFASADILVIDRERRQSLSGRSPKGLTDVSTVFDSADGEGRLLSGQLDETPHFLCFKYLTSNHLKTSDKSGAPSSALVVSAIVPEKDLLAPVHSSLRLNLGLLGGGVILIVTLILFAARLVTRPIIAVIEDLRSSSERITGTAAQVQDASHALATSSSHQAASLEETSASLEEIAATTRSNADNANRAQTLAKEARSAAESGATDMRGMSQAVIDIKTSSTKIAKITKTIDEIAFQTNILALNAAVEAARAGVAGAGFAVVADEVRSLALRASQAARETASSINEALETTERGVKISDQVEAGLNRIVQKVRAVDELNTQIAGSCQEQTRGIGEVNKAVAQMDQSTQENASTSDQTASHATELNQQASVLKGAVGALVDLLGKDAAQAPTA
jgi:hypothetical protein